ncbi:MAG: anthranilate phosphoribosyltransferase [Gammaproteobacteria bacterium]|nr:MAG: anthranilate phosphoribosyltransferase [Gammaproteobacteria bacterium]RKZ42157.1 MAG: anthranilate phosphoribosyltransferase [Gammaproteobacteria bacterium]RKZ76086.1 MAG: anthranilate phosphoribosyltransferase [Gammaproteobacteria bacterium]
MDIKSALKAVTENRDLSMDEMSSVMRRIMTGEATPAQIGGFLIGLRMKGETVEEIAAGVKIMRELVTSVSVDNQYAIDIVGTGGDGMNTFNISTTSALVVAAAGGAVAKHGNRSVSSQSGSADVLEALGVKIDLTPEQVAKCVEKVGIGFMFAPRHHSAMKHAIGPRREMGVRTIFNLLGPLTNPANVPNQLVGVFSQAWVQPVAQVLQRLGSQHVLVVHSEDGLDEISIAAPTVISELHHGSITTYTVTPAEFGLKTSDLSEIQVHSVDESATMVRSVLDNEASPARDIVVLNAGAAIYAAGLTDDFAQGITKAQNVLSNGVAREKLTAWVNLSQSF